MLERPRLAPHMALRKHLVEGITRYLLHDTKRNLSALLGPCEYRLLRATDGTRDLPGIAAAAALDPAHVSAFLQQLEQQHMLVQGPESPPSSTPVRAASLHKKIHTLPDFQLHCDGRGSCCRIYPTTLFSPLEAASARVQLPLVQEVGMEEARLFTPERGGQLQPWGARSVTMIDGACAFLDEQRLCRLHAAAGAEAKPAGCRLFPRVFRDDGVALRAGVAPECACVFNSLEPDSPTPGLLSEAIPGLLSVPAEAWIEPLPEVIPITSNRRWSREQYRTWRDALEARWQQHPPSDPAEALWQEAAALDPLDRASGLPQQLDRLEQALRHRLAQDAWRAADDLAGQAARAMLQALAGLAMELPACVQLREERFYVRALAFGDGWVREGEPVLVESLRQRCVRMWLARGLHDVESAVASDDPVWAQPLALVEAMCRAYALGNGAGWC